MVDYDPDKLEHHIYGRGPNKWEWGVGEKGGMLFRTGEVKGARVKAEAEALEALRELRDAARKKKQKK